MCGRKSLLKTTKTAKRGLGSPIHRTTSLAGETTGNTERDFEKSCENTNPEVMIQLTLILYLDSKMAAVTASIKGDNYTCARFEQRRRLRTHTSKNVAVLPKGVRL